MVEWDDYFMSMVYLVAMKSKDIRSHLGAVIVGPDKEIKSTGYNSFVRGLKDNVPERQEKPEKYFWFEHAERNAILNATLIGTSLKGCKMYTNGIPCMDCSRALVQAGIKEVIVDKSWDDGNRGDDLEHTKRALQMFEEVGIKVRYWEGKLLNIEKFRRGEITETGVLSSDVAEEKNFDKMEKVKVKIKKLHPLARVPSHNDNGIYVISKEINGDYIEYGTGLLLDIPHNCEIVISPIDVDSKEMPSDKYRGILNSENNDELKLRFKKSNNLHKIGDKVGEIKIPENVVLELI